MIGALTIAPRGFTHVLVAIDKFDNNTKRFYSCVGALIRI
jgi:hypothetical protein